MLTASTPAVILRGVTDVNIFSQGDARMTSRRHVLLAAVCLAVFAINLDGTIVNVALPSLTRQLGATTHDLQWIVDGYNLAFAALVLAAGSIGDRFGRRPALIVGLVGFAATSGLSAICTSAGALIATRFATGAFAALVFPTTLSIITNAYPDRSERVKAIGVWGAVTGLGVAVGPVTSGLLLEHFGWESVFVALVPIALIAAAWAYFVVPESRDPEAPALDRAGLALASAAIGLLVYTIIEAPNRGWLAPLSIAGYVVTVLLVAAFVRVERRQEHPMLDVTLFRQRAFSAASASVTVAYFALFGFVFLITQYMQFIRGWDPLSTGARILPVALSIGVSSVVGARLAGRYGTRAVVTSGLLLFSAAFAWISQASTTTPYEVIVLQMLMMGTGLGLTATPATESILSVLPAAKAGIGSAVNDATREAGGTLGVAVVGSVYTSLFTATLGSSAVAHLPDKARHLAGESVGAAMAVVHRAPDAMHAALIDGVNHSFMTGLQAGCFVAAGVCWLGAIGALALPGRRRSNGAAAVAAGHRLAVGGEA
jgi:EmrB/QacA subfamily drug resistance transporter